MDKFSQPKRDMEHDFDSIENAVLETPRGRWFLAEYARRNNQMENEFLLLSIRRLENHLSQKSTSPEAHDLLLATAKILDITESITRTIGIDHQALDPADHPLRGIPLEAEDLNTEMTLAADQIRDLADTLKHKRPVPELAKKIAQQATLIMDLGSRQTQVLKRVHALVEMQRIIELNLTGMIDRTLSTGIAENDNVSNDDS